LVVDAELDPIDGALVVVGAVVVGARVVELDAGSVVDVVLGELRRSQRRNHGARPWNASVAT
jgi:hypothetical protein